jgi:IclR family transcriptional regulator, acetate operon repressor
MPQKQIPVSEKIVIDKHSRSSGPVVRSFSILHCISEGTTNLSDISKKCKMSYSTTHGLLQKLIRANAVIQDPFTHEYLLGQLIPRMVSNILNTHQYLVNCSMPEMKRLAEATQERITLTILIGFKPFRLNAISGKHALRVVDEEEELDIAETFLAAPGKVLYSQLSKDTLLKMARLIKPGSWPDTESAYNELMKDIRQVQQNGYFATTGLRLQGVSCISVPVQGYFLPVALNVIGPETRIKPNLKSYLSVALKSSASISAELEAEPKN